jgi:hypothetical protein
MTATELEAYSTGLTAGGKWFKGQREPPKNPYEDKSPEAEQWERGLYTASNDLENACYS